jgi:hypothetical protein
VDAPAETEWFTATVSPTLLTTGQNLISAEVHQRSDTSSDIGFDLELSAYGVNTAVIANTPPATPPPIDFSGSPAIPAQLEFDLHDANNGRLYLIECSDDLGEWTPFSYEFVRGGEVQVPILPNGPERFYRARWLPSLP